MSTPLIIAVSVAYVWTAFEQFKLGNSGYAIMFASYAMANVGLLTQVLSK